MEDEPGQDQPAMAEHEGEQPHDPRHRGLVGEDDLEMSKVDLSLVSWRRLEANLACRQWRWPQFTKQLRDGGIAAGVTALRGSRHSCWPVRPGKARSRKYGTNGSISRERGLRSPYTGAPGRGRSFGERSSDRGPIRGRSPRQDWVAIRRRSPVRALGIGGTMLDNAALKNLVGKNV